MEARQALQGSLGTRTGRIPRARSEVNPRFLALEWLGGGPHNTNGKREAGSRKQKAGRWKQRAGSRKQEPGWTGDATGRKVSP